MGANLDAGVGQPGFVARYGLGAGDDSRDEVATWVWNIATVKFPEATRSSISATPASAYTTSPASSSSCSATRKTSWTLP